MPNFEPPQPEGAHSHSPDSDSTKGEHANHDHASGGLFGEKSELVFAILAGVLLVFGWLFAWQDIGPLLFLFSIGHSLEHVFGYKR